MLVEYAREVTMLGLIILVITGAENTGTVVVFYSICIVDRQTDEQRVEFLYRTLLIISKSDNKSRSVNQSFFLLKNK